MDNLRRLIREVIEEIGLHQKTRVIDYGRIDAERKENDDRPKIKPMTSDEESDHLSNIEMEDLENSVELAMADDECQSVDAFAEWAYDEGIKTYSVVQLQALARNVSGQPAPGPKVLNAIKSELAGYGLSRGDRAKIDRSRRGPTSNINGRHPFANSGGGGSGFGPGGEIRGGTWSPTAPGALSMGSKRR